MLNLFFFGVNSAAVDFRVVIKWAVSYSLAEAATLLDVPADKILKLVQSRKIHPMTASTTGGEVLAYFFTDTDLTRIGELLKNSRHESNAAALPNPDAEVYHRGPTRADVESQRRCHSRTSLKKSRTS